MTRLWDALSAERQDCVFLFITHNLEFAASRPGTKYIIQEYHPTPNWRLQEVPQDENFNEDFVTLILGSRQPVLFVEGNASTSLDRIIYRSCYPDHLVVALESSSAVIHAVTSMRNNAEFTRIDCQGIIDRDHRAEEEIEHLFSLGVHVLPVAEIENILLLPDVSRVIAEIEGYKDGELDAQLQKLRNQIFNIITDKDEFERTVLRWTKRRIDIYLKHLDLRKADNIDVLKQCYNDKTASIDISDIASQARSTIQGAADKEDLSAFLTYYDNKGMFAIAASTLKRINAKEFRNWLERVLTNGSLPQLTAAIQAYLPQLLNRQKNTRTGR